MPALGLGGGRLPALVSQPQGLILEATSPNLQLPAPGRSGPFPTLGSLPPHSTPSPSPPPHSCWEWRLHFSCHLHSQSIRTPQLSRLAELGGRRRRNGSSGAGASAPLPFRPRLLPAPPCAAGPAREGSRNPCSSSPSSEGRTREGRRRRVGRPIHCAASPAFAACSASGPGWQVRGGLEARVGGRLRPWPAFLHQAGLSSHTPAGELTELISAGPWPLPDRGPGEGGERVLGRKGPPSLAS